MISESLIKRFTESPEASDPLLLEAVREAERVQVHTLQTLPEDLLEMERPNESPKVKQYRKDIYRCPTQSAASKIITNIRKIPNAQGYKMQLPTEPRPLVREDKELNLYLTKDFPEWDSFEHYVWRHLAEQDINDPGAIIAVYPRHLETGAPFIDGIDWAEPFPFLYRSSEVLEYIEGEHVVILKADDKSLIGKQGEEKAEGNVLLFVDRYQFLTLEQFGSEGKYRERWRWEHSEALLPAWQMGGLRILKKNKNYKVWASPLSPCLSDWEKAILRDSDEQACLIDHVAPEKWMKTTIPCPSCNGVAPTDTTNATTCNTCKGGLYIAAASPYNVHTFGPTQGGIGGTETHIPGEPMGYVQKDIAAVQFISEKVAYYITKGLDALGLAILDYVPLAESALAKQQDKSEAETFYNDFGTHIRDQIMLPCIYFMQAFRYPMLTPVQRAEYYNAVRIEIPTTFSLLHPAYYQARAAQARKDGESPLMIIQAELDNAQNQYGDDSETFLIMQAMAQLDPYPNLTVEEKQTLAMMSDADTKQKIAVSLNLYNLIQDAADEKPDFFTLTRKEKKAIIYGLVPAATNPLIGSAIENGEDAPTDVQAESQAKLKGTVGGVQGILAIQESVGAGLTDYTAGVAMLMSIYGYTEQTAKEILGTPRKIEPTAEPASKLLA